MRRGRGTAADRDRQAQGSSWGNVLVFDDGLGRTAEDRARWLYTAITRAEEGAGDP
ncbi:MAG: ATP-binding domain-containing protein [Defluviicoccus sp.]|nr:MAG: ATP-binding domain-containing protein [Defluviicoccus sp.]